ncbi:hypothetical protein QR680_011692 [Steinernema hermaphroditum]|uniref:Uncharacterized protein n=1 Tax=Steinernema hermaphroditum TaxID=289476 RepID=A0AA39HZE7_9BILA|nr:hypothetical protein QR680_011692 [Steinernema hermaphroditum]
MDFSFRIPLTRTNLLSLSRNATLDFPPIRERGRDGKIFKNGRKVAKGNFRVMLEKEHLITPMSDRWDDTEASFDEVDIRTEIAISVMRQSASRESYKRLRQIKRALPSKDHYRLTKSVCYENVWLATRDDEKIIRNYELTFLIGNKDITAHFVLFSLFNHKRLPKDVG